MRPRPFIFFRLERILAAVRVPGDVTRTMRVKRGGRRWKVYCVKLWWPGYVDRELREKLELGLGVAEVRTRRRGKKLFIYAR